ncbi:MAG: hypothetical protein AAFV93_09995 [Chloroflexota bacterium]
MPHYTPIQLRWNPTSSEFSTSALKRMKQNFPEPSSKPPVAWFLSGIEYHGNISNFRECSQKEIIWFFHDFAGGVRSFGRLKIWVDWIHHLLPYIIQMEWDKEWNFYDILDCIYAIYPHEMHEEYLGFHQDIFHTLMKIIINKRYWNNGDFSIPDWAKELDNYEPEWNEYNSDLLLASIEFCTKYLPLQDFPEWIKSIAILDRKSWQLQVHHCLQQLKDNPNLDLIPQARYHLLFEEFRKYPLYSEI